MAVKNLLGIFDSGIGGFSVYKEVRKNVAADILYYGDCARAPYGNKSEAEIVSYIKEILLYLQAHKVTHFISACNSMSVLTTKALLEELHIEEEKYFDMISAVKCIPFGLSDKILIIGTTATLQSQVYQSILEEKGVPYAVYSPTLLAGSIEQNNKAEIEIECEKIVSLALDCGANKVLYACTHYPLIHDNFLQAAKHNNWNGVYIDPAVYLGRIISELNLTGDNQSTFEASLLTDTFIKHTKNTSV